MEGGVNKMFKKIASAKIRNFLTRAKKYLKKPPHVTIEDWAVMKTKFDDPKYMLKCNKAQGHRNKYTVDGGASYCGGSISANEHQQRMTIELGRPPDVLETFARTYRKKDGTWSGDRAAKVVKTYKELYMSQETIDDVNEQKSNEELWVQAAVGPTNGRIFGLGYVGKNRMLDQASFTNKLCLEFVTMKDTMTNLQVKNDAKDEEIRMLKLNQEYSSKQIELCQENARKEKNDLQLQIDNLSLHFQNILERENSMAPRPLKKVAKS